MDTKRIQTIEQLILISKRKIILENQNIQKLETELSEIRNKKKRNIINSIKNQLINKYNLLESSLNKKEKSKKKTSKPKKEKPKKKVTRKSSKITVNIIKNVLKEYNIKFTSSQRKDSLMELIRKNNLVRYCESKVKN
jgi:hypothetical protein